MMMMTFAGFLGLILSLFFILLPVGLLIALQVWLCKKSVKLGLILPIFSLVMSLLLVFSMTAFTTVGAGNISGGGELTVEEDGAVVERQEYRDGMVTVYDGEGNVLDQYPDPDAPESQQGLPVKSLMAVAFLFLVANIPTLVFGGIWLHFKGRQDTREDLKKMRIEDLG